MGRKYFYLLAVLPFYLVTLLPFTATAASIDFPIKGGKTSDGITISDVELENFTKSKDSNSLKLKSGSKDPCLSFNVKVPTGKTASLQYQVFFKMSPKGAGKSLPAGSNIKFDVTIDDKLVLTHTDPTCIRNLSDEVIISAGSHEVSIGAIFIGKDCRYSGTIDDLTIHIHQFGETEVTKVALCNEPGESTKTCALCGAVSVTTIQPAYKKHKFVETIDKKNSCMSSADTLFVCQQCPKKEIHRSNVMTEHKFDQNGRCTVCHLQMPRCNADSSVYEINSAGELRVLAELVSIGRISGNIGVDIKSDIEFNDSVLMLPLGTVDHPFQGVLNGNGHRIRGITTAYQGMDCLGFVGMAKGTLLSHAVIANLIFDRGNSLQGTACVGGIVGRAEDCEILNCASFGTLEGTNNVGGIVGYAGQQVSITNCAAVNTIRTYGRWNTMVCAMPMGHILNSYGAGTNDFGGRMDSLMTTTLRHCFTTLGSDEGLTQVSSTMLMSYNMVKLLNEESETPCFMKSESDLYPIPVCNTAIGAKANRAIRVDRTAVRRASATDTTGDDGGDDNGNDGKRVEIVTFGDYAKENSPSKYYHTIEEVLREDSVKYADFERLYVVSHSVPKGFDVYDQISGGDLLGLESYKVAADSSAFSMTEFKVVMEDKVKAVTETVNYSAGGNERIDEYKIGDDGTYTLTARLTFKGQNGDDVLYQKNVDGIMKTAWYIETKYDEEGKAVSSDCYTYNYTTGETLLDYSHKYSDTDDESTLLGDSYVEYLDTLDNTIHIIINDIDSIDGKVLTREHYILRGSDQCPIEILTEKMVDGEPVLLDGLYFLYDSDGSLVQSVAYGPVADDPDGELQPYKYYEYMGFWQPTPYTTAIKVPSVQTSVSMQKRMDSNVYDMHGRVVRKVTDMQDPFSGLPRGLYVYQGTKFIKR